jgi:hypothetical protein
MMRGGLRAADSAGAINSMLNSFKDLASAGADPEMLKALHRETTNAISLHNQQAEVEGNEFRIGKGIQNMKCQKCENRNTKQLLSVNGKDLLCNNCMGSGMFANRSRIPQNAKISKIGEDENYKEMIRRQELNNSKANQRKLTSYDHFLSTVPRNLFKGDVEKQLTSKYVMYGKPNESLANLTAAGIGLATHKYSDNVPKYLMANIYGGLSKLVNESHKSKHGGGIKLHKLNTFNDLSAYVKSDPFTLLNTIREL